MLAVGEPGLGHGHVGHLLGLHLVETLAAMSLGWDMDRGPSLGLAVG